MHPNVRRHLDASIPEWIGGLLTAATLAAIGWLRQFRPGPTVTLVAGVILAAGLLYVVRSREISMVLLNGSQPRFSRRARVMAGLAFVVVASAVLHTLFRELTRVTLTATCSWSREPAAALDEQLYFSCEIANEGTSVLREVVLELPFLCSRASLDEQEASGRFGSRVFRANPRPPAPFSVGEIGVGRKAQLRFFPLVRELRQATTAEWCQPRGYSLTAAEVQGHIEIGACILPASPAP